MLVFFFSSRKIFCSFFCTFQLWKAFRSTVLFIGKLFRRGNKQFHFHFRRLRAHIFCPKMQITLPMRKEIDGEVVISRQGWSFCFVNKTLNIFLPTSCLDLMRNQKSSASRNKYKRRNGSTKIYDN